MFGDIKNPLDVATLLEMMWANGNGEYCDTTAEGFRYVTADGIPSLVAGQDLTYDSANRPTSGAITRIDASIGGEKLLSIIEMQLNVNDLTFAYRLGWRKSLAFVLLYRARLEFGPAASSAPSMDAAQANNHAFSHRPPAQQVQKITLGGRCQ